VSVSGSGSKGQLLRRARTVLAWIAISGAVSVFLATWAIEPRYPTELARLGGPRAPEWMYTWRVTSLYVALLSTLLSLPRWQAIVALLAVITYAFFFAAV
jgi:cytochrome c-type biogenesis protein CcmH/NrfG